MRHTNRYSRILSGSNPSITENPPINGVLPATPSPAMPASPELAPDGVETQEHDFPETVAAGLQETLVPAAVGFCPAARAPSASTEHFRLDEFHSRDGVEVPEDYRGNVQQIMNNLEVLRSELGGAPITVFSGYRSPAHNQSVGGVSRSRHLCGQAADIRIADIAPSTVHATIERLIGEGRMRQGGLGIYDTFVHYDVRGTQARWDRRSTVPLGMHTRSSAAGNSWAFNTVEPAPWERYMPWPAGTRFDVDGPLSYDGEGEVLERTGDVLKIRLDMPADKILGQQLPATQLELTLTYRQEGAGNQAVIALNGEQVIDDNVQITSQNGRRVIIPSLSPPGHTLDRVELGPDNDQEIDLDITIDGRSWDFDLERRPTPTAQSWTHPLVVGDISPDMSSVRSFGDIARIIGEAIQKKQKFTAGIQNPTIFPHSAICQLSVRGDDGSRGLGTGFYIAPNRILTVGHNLAFASSTTVAVTVHPGRHHNMSTFPSFRVTGSSNFVPHPNFNPNNTVTNSDGSIGVPASFADWDLGVIKVSTPPPNNAYFEIEEQRMSPASGIAVCGYAAEGNVEPNQQNLDVDTIRDLLDNRFTYALHIRRGSSGAPVFYFEGDRVIATGIQSVGGDPQVNTGCRLTDAKVSWIHSV